MILEGDHTTTILRPFFRDHPGEPVPEENFWTLWCRGRLTEADTETIRQGATLSGLTSAYLHHPRWREKCTYTFSTSILTAVFQVNMGLSLVSFSTCSRRELLRMWNGFFQTGVDIPFPTTSQQCQISDGKSVH